MDNAPLQENSELKAEYYAYQNASLLYRTGERGYRSPKIGMALVQPEENLVVDGLVKYLVALKVNQLIGKIDPSEETNEKELKNLLKNVLFLIDYIHKYYIKGKTSLESFIENYAQRKNLDDEFVSLIKKQLYEGEDTEFNKIKAKLKEKEIKIDPFTVTIDKAPPSVSLLESTERADASIVSFVGFFVEGSDIKGTYARQVNTMLCFLPEKIAKEFSNIFNISSNSDEIGEIYRYVWSHYFPLESVFVSDVKNSSEGYSFFYGVKPKNYAKKYSPDEVKKRVDEKIEKLDNYDQKIKERLRTKLYELVDTLSQLNSEYFQKYFEQIFFKKDKESFDISILDSNKGVYYQRFAVKKDASNDKEREVIKPKKKIIIESNLSVERFLFVVEGNQQKQQKLGNKIIGQLKLSLSKKKEYGKYLSKSMRNLLYQLNHTEPKSISWEDLFFYFNLYRKDESFDEISRGNSFISPILFYYDVLSGIVALKLVIETYKLLPIFVINSTVIDKKTGKEEIREVDLKFYQVVNSLFYGILQNNPFQTIREANARGDLLPKQPAIFKNFLISMLKNTKKVSFPIDATKDLSGYVVWEEVSNNIVPFNPEDPRTEIQKKHRIFHIYRFEIKKEGKLSISYHKNIVRLAGRIGDVVPEVELDPKDYIIFISEKLEKGEAQKVSEEIFKNFNENHFNYVKVLKNTPFIRRIPQKKTSEKGFLIYKEDSGQLSTVSDILLGEDASVGKVFTILYYPPVGRDNLGGKKDFPFFTSLANQFLVYHNNVEIFNAIEKILFGLTVYSSESYFDSYSKIKDVLDGLKNKSVVTIRKSPESNEKVKFSLYLSALQAEAVFLAKRIGG